MSLACVHVSDASEIIRLPESGPLPGSSSSWQPLLARAGERPWASRRLGGGAGVRPQP